MGANISSLSSLACRGIGVCVWVGGVSFGGTGVEKGIMETSGPVDSCQSPVCPR